MPAKGFTGKNGLGLFATLVILLIISNVDSNR